MTKITPQEWIKRFRKTHGDRYDYPSIEEDFEKYGGLSETEIDIMCKRHGLWKTTPTRHKNGVDCPKCNKEKGSPKKKSPLQWLKKFKQVHGNKYKYPSLINNPLDNGNKTKITIVCPEHGKFKQSITGHSAGKNCPKCAHNAPVSNEEWLRRFREKHRNRYEYPGFMDKKKHINSEKIKIYCKKHEITWDTTTIAGHWSGSSCPKCSLEARKKWNEDNAIGWKYSSWGNKGIKSKNFDSFKVYIIKCWNDEEEFYKIGRTFKKIKRRFDHHNALPYNWEIVDVIESDNFRYICEKEVELKNQNKGYKYKPNKTFNGMYECFSEVHFEE